jgi:hypothetical protein
MHLRLCHVSVYNDALTFYGMRVSQNSIQKLKLYFLESPTKMNMGNVLLVL